MTRHLPAVARITLGLIFVIFGSNAILTFIPMPPPPAAVIPFMTGMASTGYFFPLLKVTEIGSGLLLLSNRFVPLALILLSPVVVNILGFHLALERSGLGLTFFMTALLAYLGWAYRASFRSVLVARAEPAARPAAEGHKEPAVVGAG